MSENLSHLFQNRQLRAFGPVAQQSCELVIVVVPSIYRLSPCSLEKFFALLVVEVEKIPQSKKKKGSFCRNWTLEMGLMCSDLLIAKGRGLFQPL